MISYDILWYSMIFDSCIKLAVASHMCGTLNQNVHRTFWLKHPCVFPSLDLFQKHGFLVSGGTEFWPISVCVAVGKDRVAGFKPCLSYFLFSPLVASKASSDALPPAGGRGRRIIAMPTWRLLRPVIPSCTQVLPLQRLWPLGCNCLPRTFFKTSWDIFVGVEELNHVESQHFDMAGYAG